jgi:hypothetical protein
MRSIEVRAILESTILDKFLYEKVKMLARIEDKVNNLLTILPVSDMLEARR